MTTTKPGCSLSVVLPTGGNHPQRLRNLRENLHCLQQQTYANYELIIVEQSLDGRYFHADKGADKYVPLRDPQKRGYNRSWVRNVGAAHAEGDMLVLMDADYVFRPDFLAKVAGQTHPVFSGTDRYVWTSLAKVEDYLRTRNLDELFDHHDTFAPFVSGKGFGGILCFDMAWYRKEFVGYIENFFKFGWEDKEAAIRIQKLLNCGVQELGVTPDNTIAHLWHTGKDYNLHRNKRLKLSYDRQPIAQIQEQLHQAGLGKKQRPTLIKEYC